MVVEIPITQVFRGGVMEIQIPDPSGTVVKRKVNIPSGVRSGQALRLRGLGAPTWTGESGDLILEIKLVPDELFRFEGDDLVTTLRLAPWEAVLGAKVEVETPDGRVQLKVPPGTTSGKKLRLRGRGYPLPNGERGDLYAVVEIHVPSEITPEEQALYEKLARLSGFRPRG
ncbi:MAG: HSP40/DnaJ peptide-binding protein [Sandaracinaceae bacterium]|nr:HSP40/DnaJ peptide-binding protein [Sandaracinaceae bacterium]